MSERGKCCPYPERVVTLEKAGRYAMVAQVSIELKLYLFQGNTTYIQLQAETLRAGAQFGGVSKNTSAHANRYRLATRTCKKCTDAAT